MALYHFFMAEYSAGKEYVCIVGDLVSIPGLGRSPGEGKGYPLQYSELENSRDYSVHGVAKSQTRLSDFPEEGNGNPLQYSCLENPMEEEPGRLQSMGSQRARHD